MLTDFREPSVQVKAYLKRMAQSYEHAPEPAPCEEIDALLDALRGADPDSDPGF